MDDDGKQKPHLERLSAFGKKTGQETMLLAVRSVKLYLTLAPLGSFAGGLGAYFYAAHAQYGFWLSSGAVLLGIFIGALLGFFTAQIIIAMLVEDIIWDKSTTVAKTGYAEIKKILKTGKDEKPD